MSEPKHIVGVVGNDIVFDTRIKKVGAAAAAAGFKSTILCYTATGVRRVTRMGLVDVIRVPVTFDAHAKNGRVPALLRPFNGAELAARHNGPRIHLIARRRWLDARLAVASTRSERLRLALALTWVKVSLKARHETFRIRRKLHVEFDRIGRMINRIRKRVTLRAFRRYRDPVPNIADYEVSLGPILEELAPDLIHAHDYHMIGIAVTAATNLRRTGKPVKVLYDAHEWIEGLSYPLSTIDGWLQLESRYIHEVDAVTGVSPEQVAQIRDRYHLELTPTVVLNAPVLHGGSAPLSDIRADLGLTGTILAYHGNIFLERGLSTLIDALSFLDNDVHVAILAPQGNPLVRQVEDHAVQRGKAARVHVLRYVPADQLPGYLATADLAVVPYLPTGNNDIALPNKLFEAVQAGLPLLVSDMRSMRRLVTEAGIGEVFRAGDARDLADKADKILRQPERYRSRITDSLKRELSWDTQAERLTDVYHGLLGTTSSAQLAISAVDITEGDEASSDRYRPSRLAIGPRNMAGQAYAIAAAVQSHTGIPAISFSVEKPLYRFPIHIQIDEQQWHDPAWQGAQRKLLADGFTHVIAESGTGILGAMNGGFIDEQLEILRADGIEVAVLLHGSEIRDPARHRQLPFSPYAINDPLIHAMEEAQARLRTHLNRTDVPVFVTTPDLLDDVETAAWLPVVIDIDRWTGLKPAFTGPVPTILHLPTNGLLKGSDFVDPVLLDLEAQGQVRYLRPKSGAAFDVPFLIEQADIVIDQVVIGAYGLMSVQTLAAGRLSIANVRDIKFLRPECPIIHADPSSLRRVLEETLLDRNGWADRVSAGRRFVREYHDGAAAARTLRTFLDLS